MEGGGNFTTTIENGNSLPGNVSYVDNATSVISSQIGHFSYIDPNNPTAYQMLQSAVAYNGLGGGRYGTSNDPLPYASPYTAGPNATVPGKYDYDGHFNPGMVTSQPGIAALLGAVGVQNQVAPAPQTTTVVDSPNPPQELPPPPPMPSLFQVDYSRVKYTPEQQAYLDRLRAGGYSEADIKAAEDSFF
jgi:hypothetical protein